MEENNNKKKKILIIVIGLILIAGIGVTIAYFASRSMSDTKTITTGSLSIVYENDNTINIDELFPIYKSKIETGATKISFDVTNKGKQKGYAAISLEEIVITDNLKNADFKYTLYDGETNKEITEGNFNFVGTKANVINDIELNSNESKKYKLCIWIEETDENQNNMMNGSISGKGTGASTIETIYGIYDMVGGAWEYTMSNWFDTNSTGTVGNSGFTTNNYPGGSNNSKYYDKYTKGTSSTAITKEKAIKGDATYETERWYSDSGGFVLSIDPWATRGGRYNSTPSAGIFCSNVDSGGITDSNIAFRSVLIP